MVVIIPIAATWTALTSALARGRFIDRLIFLLVGNPLNNCTATSQIRYLGLIGSIGGNRTATSSTLITTVLSTFVIALSK